MQDGISDNLKESLNKWFQLYLDHEIRTALKLKEEGNRFFKKKAYNDAILKYTHSIGNCDVKLIEM